MKNLQRNTAYPGTEMGANTGGSNRPEALYMSAPYSKWQRRLDNLNRFLKTSILMFFMQRWLCSQQFQILPRTFIKLVWAELQVPLPRSFMQLQEGKQQFNRNSPRVGLENQPPHRFWRRELCSTIKVKDALWVTTDRITPEKKLWSWKNLMVTWPGSIWRQLNRDPNKIFEWLTF